MNEYANGGRFKILIAVLKILKCITPKKGLVMKEKIVNYFGLNYLIREDGKIFSTNRFDKNGNPKEIKQRFDRYGYLVVTLGIESKRKCRTVHKIIAETFIPNNDRNLEIDHIDDNKCNNNLSNLQWITHFENVSKIPFERRSKSRKGSKNGMAKLNEMKVKNIRQLYLDGYSIKEIAQKYDCSYTNISAIVKGKIWKE